MGSGERRGAPGCSKRASGVQENREIEGAQVSWVELKTRFSAERAFGARTSRAPWAPSLLHCRLVSLTQLPELAKHTELLDW